MELKEIKEVLKKVKTYEEELYTVEEFFMDKLFPQFAAIENREKQVDHLLKELKQVKEEDEKVKLQKKLDKAVEELKTVLNSKQPIKEALDYVKEVYTEKVSVEEEVKNLFKGGD